MENMRYVDDLTLEEMAFVKECFFDDADTREILADVGIHAPENIDDDIIKIHFDTAVFFDGSDGLIDWIFMD